MNRKTSAWTIPIGAALIFAALAGASWKAAAPGAAAPAAVAPRRIVSLAPSVTEILFALGLGDRVAGVTDFCDFPAEAQSRPHVGGFKGKSLEAIVGLSPDLVIGTRDGNEEQLFQSLARLRIPVLSVQPATVLEAIASMRTIAAAAGRPEAGQRLAAELEARLHALADRVRGAPRPRVLFVYGRDPLVLAGPGTFADDMLHWAGGDNVAADAGLPYPRFSLEAVVARVPEVIVEGAMGSEGAADAADAARAYWSRWPSLPAVRDGRIALIEEDLISRPGPRLLDGLDLLARALHPERFPPSAAGATP